MFEPTSIVKVQGLQARPELNGTFGIIKRFIEDSNRFEVIKSRGKGSLSIKPENLSQEQILKPSDKDFTNDQSWEQIAFWPNVNGVVPVQPLRDWPHDQFQEEHFLSSTLGYQMPKVLGGVESEGVAKPNFCMYFDAADNESPVNETAEAIAALLPSYELFKISRSMGEGKSRKPFRGACVLIYSPMKITNFSSFGGPMNNATTTSGNEDTLFSAAQLKDVLDFHKSEEAKRQYQAHDNPMHRVFGGK